VTAFNQSSPDKCDLLDLSPRAALPSQAAIASSSGSEGASSGHRASLTLISFGFKYGRPPANHYFDVSFLKNPARENTWDLWSEPCGEMRDWVLNQEAAQEFLQTAVPLALLLSRVDDGARIALGCSAGRHRSTILTEELARRLRATGLEIAVIHREREVS
jgi:UPF0042 nucleotide-binding protein